MNTPLPPSIVRTVVPYIVGYIIYVVSVGLARLTGAEVDLSGLSNFLEQVIVIAVSAVYYAVVRWLEVHRAGRWGWLLGNPNPPAYPDVNAPATL